MSRICEWVHEAEDGTLEVCTDPTWNTLYIPVLEHQPDGEELVTSYGLGDYCAKHCNEIFLVEINAMYYEEAEKQGLC